MGFLICTALYFLPTIVAARRGHRVLGTFLVNLFVGWTILGWILQMVWACSLPDYRAYYGGNAMGEYGWNGPSWRAWDGRPLAPVYCWTCRRQY